MKTSTMIVTDAEISEAMELHLFDSVGIITPELSAIYSEHFRGRLKPFWEMDAFNGECKRDS